MLGVINRKVINYAFKIRFISSFWILLKQKIYWTLKLSKDYKASKQSPKLLFGDEESFGGSNQQNNWIFLASFPYGTNFES